MYPKATQEIFDKFTKTQRHNGKWVVLVCFNEFANYRLFYKLENLGITWCTGTNLLDLTDCFIDSEETAYCLESRSGIKWSDASWYRSKDDYEVYEIDLDLLN